MPENHQYSCVGRLNDGIEAAFGENVASRGNGSNERSTMYGPRALSELRRMLERQVMLCALKCAYLGVCHNG